MSNNPNKLNRFWQELKRRKVIYVITVYASASFVLIELVNNVLEPLNLPENLSTIVIIALAVGFPIVLVLSWIFDMTPKGIEKTKAADVEAEGKKEVTSNAWRIATYISVVIIAGLVIFNVFTRTGIIDEEVPYGKSIAVLPFINDSQNEEDELFINGTMESILNKLCKIRDLRVMNRQSVEQYRDTIVPIPEICEQLGVSYVMTGSIRKYGDLFVMNLQLIDQGGNTIWSGQNERDIDEIEELFLMESSIAQQVASQIKATITPEEKLRIEKVPTTDPWALHLCREAQSDYFEFMQSRNPEYLRSANKLYHEALQHDSTYAEAIAGFGWIYWAKNRWNDPTQEDFLDSVRIYADLSLTYDNERADTYLLLGFYHFSRLEWNAALESYNKSLEFNSNNPVAYTFIGNIYLQVYSDYLNAIRNYEKAESRNRGQLISNTFYRLLGAAYTGAGFFDLSEEYVRKALVLDNDTAVCYSMMGNVKIEEGKFNEAADYEVKAYAITPNITYIGLWNLIYSEQIEEASIYAHIFEEKAPHMSLVQRGYLSLYQGEKDNASKLFNQFTEEFKKGIRSKSWRFSLGNGHTEMSMIYSYRGQKEEAYRLLEELVDMKTSISATDIHHLEVNSMFENIREEDRFQEILRKMQSKYMSEHERVRLYLKETGRI